MKTRYALALTALLALPAGTVYADQHQPPAAGEMSEPLENPEVQKDLKLTEDQKKQLKAIHEEARAKHEAIRKETHDKVSKVLTAEQMQKLEEKREKRMDRREQRMEKRMEKMQERQQRGY